MTAPHLRDGSAAEKLACRWLEQQGLCLLEANFRCKSGELDLVMLDGHCLVIVEVRYRAGRSHGGALVSISATKQKRILRATRHYLQRHKKLRDRPLRFDVVALHGQLHEVDIDWRRQAFDATQHYYR